VEENLWFKSLSNRLDTEEFRHIRDEVSQQDKATHISAFWDAIVRANIRIVKEVIKMDEVPLSFIEVLEETGWVAKWENKAEDNKALKIAKNMVNRGYAFEEIASITQLDPEKVKALYQNP